MSRHTLEIFAEDGALVYSTKLPFHLVSAMSCYTPNNVRAAYERAYRDHFGIPVGGGLAMSADRSTKTTELAEHVFEQRSHVELSVYRQGDDKVWRRDETSRRCVTFLLTNYWTDA